MITAVRQEHWQHLRLDRDQHGLITVWIDVADQRMNVFNDSVLKELGQLVDQLEQDSTARVVLFRSGKDSGFFAGADVRQIAELRTEEQIARAITTGQQLFSRIERLRIPAVAAIHGPCLGGGLEFALACRHRIALDQSATRLGLPEVQLGLIPGWGGTQRLPRLIGLARALPMILKGNRLSARRAWQMGLVDAVADEGRWEELIARFGSGRFQPVHLKSDNRQGLKLFRQKAIRFAMRSLHSIADRIGPGRRLILKMASRQIARDARNYPALPAALRAVAASGDSRRNGFDVECAEFIQLLQTSACRHLINLFFRREQARALSATQPDGGDQLQSIAVIGAGAMGAGIAQLAAQRGYRVVLKEINAELATAGRERVTRSLDELVAGGRLSAAERAACMDRIVCTHQLHPLADADLVIEAVVERMDVKRAVFAELDTTLKPRAVIVSNTSALSITAMAEATQRKTQIAGLHFFNPVHRMDLVEVVRTADTSPETLRLLLSFVRKLGKTPVITADAPGFIVNRVLFPYLGEAMRMLLEGHTAEALDREIRKFGMPMGPIELLDYVGLDVALHVASTLQSVLPDSGEVLPLLEHLVGQGSLGRKNGRGFYIYKKGRRHAALRLPPEARLLIQASPSGGTRDSAVSGVQGHDFRSAVRSEDSRVLSTASDEAYGRFLDDGLSSIQRRLIYPLINQAAHCLQEVVATDAWMVDLAIVLGTGFAPFRGGPLSMAGDIGLEAVLNNLAVLRARHGERFKAAAMLVEQHAQSRPLSVRKQATTESSNFLHEEGVS